MKEIAISIIIPVYNVEEYVRECLESVICQMDSSIEVIIVNDGSVDHSCEICQDIISSLKEPYSICLSNQNNQGLSMARNNGMAMAHGEYIMFLDADDMLANNIFAKLGQYISAFPNVEMFFFDAVIKNEMEKPAEDNRYTRVNSVDSIVVSGREYFEKYYFSPMIVSSCMCLYKRNFLRQNNFMFEPGRLHEDIFFSFRTVLTAKDVLYIPEALYVRRYRANSITMVKKSSRHVQDHIYAYGQCMALIENYCSDTRIINPFYYFIYTSLFYFDNVEIGKNDNKTIMECFYNRVISLYCKLSKTKKSFTFYKGLSNVLAYGERREFVVDDKNIRNIQEVLSLNAILEIREHIEKIIKEFYHDIFSAIPFQDEKVTVGIYGSGKHSQQLFDEYQRQNGEIKAKILFVDSKKRSFEEKKLDYDIINIADAEKYVDIIVISSFIHQLELKKMCKKYISRKSIAIIDFYEEEKMPLF